MEIKGIGHKDCQQKNKLKIIIAETSTLPKTRNI